MSKSLLPERFRSCIHSSSAGPTKLSMGSEPVSLTTSYCVRVTNDGRWLTRFLLHASGKTDAEWLRFVPECYVEVHLDAFQSIRRADSPFVTENLSMRTRYRCTPFLLTSTCVVSRSDTLQCVLEFLVLHFNDPRILNPGTIVIVTRISCW